MCLQCHSQGSTVEELKEILENPEFERWNTTSLGHILLSIHGLDGDAVHDLANQLAEKFYTWYLGNTRGIWQKFSRYTPPHGLDPFPHSTIIRKSIVDANAFYELYKNKTREEMITLLS